MHRGFGLLILCLCKHKLHMLKKFIFWGVPLLGYMSMYRYVVSKRKNWAAWLAMLSSDLSHCHCVIVNPYRCCKTRRIHILVIEPVVVEPVLPSWDLYRRCWTYLAVVEPVLVVRTSEFSPLSGSAFRHRALPSVAGSYPPSLGSALHRLVLRSVVGLCHSSLGRTLCR